MKLINLQMMTIIVHVYLIFLNFLNKLIKVLVLMIKIFNFVEQVWDMQPYFSGSLVCNFMS